jgi:outer membrane protein assembly factor BamB
MPDYWTNCFDNLRTGWNPNEAILTPDEIKKSFILLYTCQVTGRVFAQPLMISQVTTYPGGDTSKPPQTSDVLFVATEDNFIYAFNAKDGTQIWQRQLLPANERLIQNTDLRDPNNPNSTCDNITPHYGITGTPVIDVAAKIMYVVAPSAFDAGDGTTYFTQRLYASDLATGQDHVAPAVIQTFVEFQGDPNTYTFDPHWQLQRGALLLSNGVVYIPFGSHCDWHDYHGWIMAYEANTLNFVGAFVSSTSGGEAGIWQAGRGPAADSDGWIYCMTGNGARALDPANPHNYGDCVLKLNPRPNPADSFTQNYIAAHDVFSPCNWNFLSAHDADLGSGGPMLLPDQTAPNGQVRHLLVAAGKEGTVYLLNRDRLGGINPNPSPARDRPCQDSGAITVLWRVVGTASTATEDRDALFGGPAYFAPTGQPPRIYYCGQGKDGSGDDTVRAFYYDSTNNALVGPFMQTPDTIPGGALPVVSSSGGDVNTAVLWVVSRASGTISLSAYYPDNLRAPALVKVSVGSWGGSFAPPPTVVNGQVYVGFDNGVAAFGTSLSKCFIATAAEFGESLKVLTLRTFRDEYLLTSEFGRCFVALYERLSPGFASLLRRSTALRRAARTIIVLPGFLLAKTVLAMKKRRDS